MRQVYAVNRDVNRLLLVEWLSNGDGVRPRVVNGAYYLEPTDDPAVLHTPGGLAAHYVGIAPLASGDYNEILAQVHPVLFLP